ncbi:UbiA family prenyltransferase [Streptomyces sp. SL13]|uniref:UbiA family prenyltransferase n=1 Tax=Streptantibioticus silvisoli TaxID=2705255 RepID=A0AA90H3B8_9ACTN|nr:UbiA family prenyltransferase [Streptantibioticus silvisoli]MDI5971226.1 UbiA family prenyltransferase [Streptantibioticus silvisoli]
MQTWRPYTLWYPGLVGLAGAALAGGSPSVALLLVAWGAPTLGWVAGHYLGDWFDRELDAIAKPQRPIPQGRLSPASAVAAGVACAVAAAVVAALANWRAVLLVALAVLGIVAYSRVFKGRGLSGNVVRGTLTALTVVFGAMAVRPGEGPPGRALVFAAVFLAHDTASNLVGTLRDVDGDRAGGYRTLPVARGLAVAGRTAAGLYAAAILLAFGGAARVPAHPWETVALLGCAAAAGVAAFGPVLRGGERLSAGAALRAHEVLVGERLVLAAAVLAGGRGLGWALVLLVPLLAASVLTQRAMRARHESPGADAGPAPAPVSDPRRPAGRPEQVRTAPHAEPHH